MLTSAPSRQQPQLLQQQQPEGPRPHVEQLNEQLEEQLWGWWGDERNAFCSFVGGLTTDKNRIKHKKLKLFKFLKSLI